jgi:uncharacterized ion transporter superfamily protein YfcC
LDSNHRIWRKHHRHQPVVSESIPFGGTRYRSRAVSGNDARIAAFTLNPYGTALLQGTPGSVYSRLWLRIIYFVLTSAVLIVFIYLYAKRSERDPTKSFTYETDAKCVSNIQGRRFSTWKNANTPSAK